MWDNIWICYFWIMILLKVPEVPILYPWMLHTNQHAVNLPWEHGTEGLILGSDAIVYVSSSNKIACSTKHLSRTNRRKMNKCVCLMDKAWKLRNSTSYFWNTLLSRVSSVRISAIKSPPELFLHSFKNAYCPFAEVCSGLSSPYCLASLPNIKQHSWLTLGPHSNSFNAPHMG